MGEKYDATRGASRSVLAPIAEALGPPAGRSLLDIGGGTGNFARPLAEAGFQVTLADYWPEMIRRAAAKLDGTFVVADGQQLPFRDTAFDCGISVNVLGLMPDWQRALKEARRVVRDGPLSAQGVDAGDGDGELDHELPAGATGLCAATPLPAGSGDGARAARCRLLAGRTAVIHYTDLVDGSLQALKHQPELLLDDKHILNTAVLMRVPEQVRHEAIETIRRDYARCRLREIIAEFEPLVREYGDGFVFAAR
ncbi:MAG TPA: class I SAM-dependent methyltransferase [Dehalococcoidia bacterium]